MKVETDVIEVEILGIGVIQGKVDTGAHQSSLHAENIVVDGDVVRFEHEGRFFQSALETNQDVSSSDGGTTTRPVITADVKLNGETITTLLNLNDRSEMPEALLIGQDLIRAAGLSIELPEEPSDQEMPPADGSLETQSEPVDPIDPVDSAEAAGEPSPQPESELAQIKALANQLLDMISTLEKKHDQESV